MLVNYQAEFQERRKEMKKINKCLFLLIGIVAGSFFFTDNVFASTLNFDHTGYFWQRNDPSGEVKSWYLENYYVDGEVAYCIEPGVPEGNPMIPASWEQTGLSNSIKDRITQIAYYGYWWKCYIFNRKMEYWFYP